MCFQNALKNKLLDSRHVEITNDKLQVTDDMSPYWIPALMLAEQKLFLTPNWFNQLQLKEK